MKKIFGWIVVVFAVSCQPPVDPGPSQADMQETFDAVDSTMGFIASDVKSDGDPSGTITENGGTITFTYSLVGDTYTIDMTFANVGTLGGPEVISGSTKMVFTVTNVSNIITTTGSVSASYSITGGKISTLTADYTFTSVLDMNPETPTYHSTMSGTAVADGKVFPLGACCA